MAHPEIWEVALAGWQVYGGDYAEVETGATVSFALRCALLESPQLVPLGTGFACTAEGVDCRYAIVGEVVFAGDDVAVLDFGLRAYAEGEFRVQGRPARVGDRVRAVVRLSVDDFAYRGHYAHLPAMPALTYDWVIQRIVVDTSPTVVVAPGSVLFPRGVPEAGPLQVRDPARLSGSVIERPGADDDETHASNFRLHCALAG